MMQPLTPFYYPAVHELIENVELGIRVDWINVGGVDIDLRKIDVNGV